MPKEKKIVVGLELKDREFLNGLQQIDTSVVSVGKAISNMAKDMGGGFTTLSQKMQNVNTAVGHSNETMHKMLLVLRDIRQHLADLKGVAGTTNTQLEALNKTAGRTETAVKGVGTNTADTNKSLDALAAQMKETAGAAEILARADEHAAKSLAEVSSAANGGGGAGGGGLVSTTTLANLQQAQAGYQQLSQQFNKTFASLKHGKSVLGNMIDVFNPTRMFEAAGWDLSYKIVNAPGRAFEALKSGVQSAVKDTAGLEGELFDLEAYLGGPGGQEIINFGKSLGATGSDEQIKTAGLTALQNKILEVGQKTTFTAREIAQATSTAAKAGISIQELAGETGTALDAISLLSQNTGESLDSSAESVSKLQALFESNLNKTQESFGQAANAGKQFQIIVDGLATADQASASSAQQLTEALYNVGGSAGNLNISFFETMSLVSQMVPAFESAASAGTSLKYVFSALSGGRSVKAKAAMKQFGLMDDFGQSVFFGPNAEGKTEFRGIEFMTKKLREVFGDESGMAVDVRNRIITDIFGQDALKAVSRMVSMTDDQAEQMYKMASDMTENARIGVQSAKSVAEIKNEGLEYDIEFLKGTLDSLQKTLTMPLMAPMSNITQTMSGLGNVAFAIITGAKDVETQIADTKKNLIDPSLLPGAAELFAAAQKYAYTLKDVLQIITKEGYSIDTVSRAIATLFGGSKNELAARSAEFKDVLTKLYDGISSFIKALPSLLEKFGKFALEAFSSIAKAFSWLVENSDQVVAAIKVFLTLMAVDKIATFTSNIVSMGQAFGALATAAGGISGILKNIGPITGTTSPLLLRLGSLLGGSAPVLSAGGGAATATTAAAASIPIMTTLTGLWTSFSATLATVWTSISTGTGLLAILQGAISFLISPLGLAIAAVLAFYSAWTSNTAGMQTFLIEKFGSIYTYIVNTFTMITDAVMPIWNALAGGVYQISQSTFMDGVANIFKSLATIIEGAVVFIGGSLKLLVGIFTLNGDLIKSGLYDVVSSLSTALKGVLGVFMGAVQSIYNGTVDIINKIRGFLGMNPLDNKKSSAMLTGDIDKLLTDGASKAGVDFASGLKSGIQSQNKVVAQATYGLVKNSMLDVITTTQDSHSDSKVTFGHGVDAAHGYASGIVSQYGAVREASAGLASIVLAETGGITIGSTMSGNAKSTVGSLTGTKSSYESIYGTNFDKNFLQSTITGQRVVGGPEKAFSGYGPQAAPYIYAANTTNAANDDYRAGTLPSFMRDVNATLRMSADFQNLYKANFGNVPITDENINKLLNSGMGNLTDIDKVNYLLGNMGRNTGGAAGYVQSSDFMAADFLRRNAKGSETREQVIDRIVPKMVETVYSTIAGQSVASNKPTKFMQTQMNLSRDSNFYLRSAEKALNKMSESYGGQTLTFNAETAAAYGLAGAGTYALSSTKFTQKEDTGYYRGMTPDQVKTMRERNNTDDVYIRSMRLFAKSVDDFHYSGSMYAAAVQNIASKDRAEEPLKNKGKSGYSGTGFYKEIPDKPSTTTAEKLYRWDPYNYGEWITRGMAGQINAPANMVQRRTVTNTRRLTGGERKGKIQQAAYVPVTQLPQMESFFSDAIIPEQYDSENGMVSTDVAAYKKMFGESGIKFRGLTKFFESSPDIVSQYAQVGNRAATFLSMKQGQLNAEDYKTFKELLKQDQVDKDNYLNAARTLAAEQEKIRKDPTLTDAQKQEKITKMNQGFIFDKSSMAGTYRDVLGVKVGGMADYDSAVKDNKISEQAKPYTDTAMQRVREGIATAFNPANQSEAFKKLSPEEQGKIQKAVENMPLATQAFMNSALIDGVIDDSERILLEQYSQEDVARIANVVATATLPTQADLDAAYAPYIEGTAKFTSRENITGALAPAWLSGVDNILAGAATQYGQTFATNYLLGVAKGKDGETLGLSSVTIMEALNLDPDAVAASGVKVGQNIPEGIATGIAEGSSVVSEVLTQEYDENSKTWKTIKRVIRSESPSRLYAEGIGWPISEGIAVGITEKSYLVSEALGKIFGIQAKDVANAAGMGQGMGGVGSEGAAAAAASSTPAAGAQQNTASPYFAMGVAAAKDFVTGFTNEADPVNSLFMLIHSSFARAFNPEGTDKFILDTFTKVTDFGKKIAHVLINDGFAYVIDGKDKADFTLNSTLANAIAIISAMRGTGDWYGRAVELGKNISLGIADGIVNTEALQKIKDNAVAAVKAALEAASTAGQINSPSLLFADEIGSPITEGIAHGITDSSYMLDSALNGLMSDPTRSFRPDISPIALAGQRQAEINANTTNNYNLGVHTSLNPQVVERSFAVMESFKG